MSNSLINPDSDPDRRLPDAERGATDVSAYAPDAGAPYSPPPALDFGDEEEGGVDPRRLLAALRRNWWVVLLTTALGAGAAAVAWTQASVRYTATGSLWVDAGGRGSNPGDVLPIRQSGLFETPAYIDLMRSLAVLVPVVEEQRLYLTVDPEQRELFEDFALKESFLPGDFTLQVDEAGRSWALTRADGSTVDRGEPGDSVGDEIGFTFQPPASALSAGMALDFSVVPPHQAAQALGRTLSASTDQLGNFIRVSYSGLDPERITDVVNSILERHIEVATELKRNRLDEASVALEEQLVYTQSLLAQAERDLEDFRVRTVTLPSEQSAPIAAGLEMTRGPVFTNYFNMQMELEQLRGDQERLRSVLESLPDTALPVEAIEAIPVAGQSRELQAVLTELVELRATLRTLSFRYADEYPPIQEARQRIQTISSEVIPEILRDILEELDAREARLETRVEASSSELSEIPTRAIEEARLRRRVQTQETLYNDLRRRVENARLAAASSVSDIRILDRAVVPGEPSEDQRVTFAGIFLLAGLGIGLLGAIGVDLLDGRVRYPGQVDDDLGLTILGSIPRVRGGRRKKEESQAAVLEAFRELRIAIGFAFGSAGPITLVVSSPSEGEGKTFVSANTAVAFADMGRRTLLIDGDTRRGDAHRILGTSRTPGLTDYLQDRSVGEIIQETGYANLDFIGCGARGPHTPELLASTEMASFLGSLKRAYDVIIIDSPPLSGGGDALVLASLMGHMAVVIRSGSTDKALAAAKVENLSRFPIRVLGAILNDIEPDGLYGYYPNYLPSYLTEVDVKNHEGEEGRRLVAPGDGGKDDGDVGDDDDDPTDGPEAGQAR